jgi:Carboxypeptidase regulatory-like domain/Tetratricopeptide repeat
MQHRALLLLLTVAVGSPLCFAQNVDLLPNTPAKTGAVLQPSISGVITRTDGSPVHDIRIEVRSLTTGNVVQVCNSGLNGMFNATNLRPGNYEVVAIDGIAEAREAVYLQGEGANITLRLGRASSAPRSGTISVASLKTPEKARHLVEKARAAMAKNHLDEARKSIDAALTIAPEYAEALTARAVLELDGNQVETAVADLDHAIKADPSYGEAYLVIGATFNHMGRFDDALRSLDRSSMYEPNSWQCAYEMSKAWLGKHDYDHALQQLNRAQSLGGARVTNTIHMLRGYALMGQQHFEEAAKELEAYLSAEPRGQLSGSVRAALATIKTSLATHTQAIPTPAVSGLFGQSNE